MWGSSQIHTDAYRGGRGPGTSKMYAFGMHVVLSELLYEIQQMLHHDKRVGMGVHF